MLKAGTGLITSPTVPSPSYTANKFAHFIELGDKIPGYYQEAKGVARNAITVITANSKEDSPVITVRGLYTRSAREEGGGVTLSVYNSDNNGFSIKKVGQSTAKNLFTWAMKGADKDLSQEELETIGELTIAERNYGGRAAVLAGLLSLWSASEGVGEFKNTYPGQGGGVADSLFYRIGSDKDNFVEAENLIESYARGKLTEAYQKKGVEHLRKFLADEEVAENKSNFLKKSIEAYEAENNGFLTKLRDGYGEEKLKFLDTLLKDENNARENSVISQVLVNIATRFDDKDKEAFFKELEELAARLAETVYFDRSDQAKIAVELSLLREIRLLRANLAFDSWKEITKKRNGTVGEFKKEKKYSEFEGINNNYIMGFSGAKGWKSKVIGAANTSKERDQFGKQESDSEEENARGRSFRRHQRLQDTYRQLTPEEQDTYRHLTREELVENWNNAPVEESGSQKRPRETTPSPNPATGQKKQATPNSSGKKKRR